MNANGTTMSGVMMAGNKISSLYRKNVSRNLAITRPSRPELPAERDRQPDRAVYDYWRRRRNARAPARARPGPSHGAEWDRPAARPAPDGAPSRHQAALPGRSRP